MAVTEDTSAISEVSTESMDYPAILDSVNRRAYANAKTLKWYDDQDFLFEPEEVILKTLEPVIKDKRLLDIGIGGGRTTKFLLEISKDYTGIDYLQGCVDAARKKFPGADILCRDARDLSGFVDDAFDFVLFSFNSIDYVAHEVRLRALEEIWRVLKPGGFFMFSTHNRDYEYFNKLPWQEKPQLSLEHLRNCLDALVHLPRHLRMKRYERHTDEYAIVNDSAHEFSLLAYYIRASEQIRRLEEMGFERIEAYDLDGNQIESDTEFAWLYYLARKPPA